MEKNNKKILVITVIICLLPIVLGLALYNKLPEKMPIHFTINDVPDNYAHKNFALFGKSCHNLNTKLRLYMLLLI